MNVEDCCENLLTSRQIDWVIARISTGYADDVYLEKLNF